MIKSFKVTNFLGESITLELDKPLDTGFIVKGVTGLGPAKANVNTTEVSTNDGSMFNSARLSERNIVFNFLFIESEDGESIEQIRHKSYKFFPLKKQLELVIETDNRLVRTTGYVESNEPDIFSDKEGAVVSILCPDPYFYSVGDDAKKKLNLFSIEPSFEFPFSNESLTDPLIIFGEITLQTEGVITYDGDAEVGITIRIHAIGPAYNIDIYNLGTREKMSINTSRLETMLGNGIVPSDDIIISTTKGNKSITLIREGVSYNILNCLDKNTAWFSLTKGDNVFAFTAQYGVTNLQFQIENEVIYEGV